MQVIIDSETVEIETKTSNNFEDACSLIMQWLVQRDRSISKCKIDGKLIETIEEARCLFNVNSSLEIESIPVAVALYQSVGEHCDSLKRIEEDCDELVTDSLLEEPEVLLRQWQSLCHKLKQEIGFLPNLAPLLTDEQLDSLIEKNLTELNAIMNDIQKALSKADVVAFSDILELRLSVWISNFSEFLLTQHKMLEPIAKEQTSP
ncbi:MAG: hypothetical protein AAGA18_12020 [Verrucomicrobiota bacterium]